MKLLNRGKKGYNISKGQKRSGDMHMDINQMTEKVQKAIMNAQSIATREQHQEVDEVHIYMAMLEDSDNLILSILEKMDKNLTGIQKSLQQFLMKKPKVTGSGVEQGKLYITNGLQRVFAEAEKFMKQFKDDYLICRAYFISFDFTSI